MNAEIGSIDTLSEDDVVRYLRSHGDFFGRHPTLLTDLSLPHDSGEAISLVERQVAILRERNIDMRKRLAHLVGAANVNDALFEKTRRFTLEMLEAGEIGAVDDVITRTLIEDFAADEARCFVTHPTPFTSLAHTICCASSGELPANPLTQRDGISCGMLRSDEFERLFGGSERGDGSAALIELRHGELVGVLAIGSTDPKRFSPDMGTLFIRYIGDVLARVLARLLDRNG